MPTHYDLNLKYSGPALENGTMLVKDFAPAILAFADLLEEIEKALNPKATSMDVSIQGISKGSFDVSLLLSQSESFFVQAKSLLTGQTITAVANLGGILAAMTAICEIVKRIGMKVAETFVDKSGTRTIRYVDGQQIYVPEKVFVTLQTPRMNRMLNEMTEPLNCKGIDSIEISSESSGTIVIQKKDKGKFSQPARRLTPRVSLGNVNSRKSGCHHSETCGIDSYRKVIEKQANGKETVQQWKP